MKKIIIFVDKIVWEDADENEVTSCTIEEYRTNN